jgi:hypothetical protein
MRERPSCVVELRCFGVWRSAVALVAAAAIASTAAWGGLAWIRGADDAVPVATVATAVAFLSAVLASSLARVDPGTLSCAAGVWTFAARRGGVERIETGALSVAIDLGSFLLLTLTPVGAPGPSRRWLPVQRRGIEARWHALRCAVYSPPPGGDRAAAAAHERPAE